MVTKTKVPMPTKEQIEYEEAKKDFRVATAKARLNSAGIDSSKISQQVIDKVMRIFDDMDHIQQDTQQKTSKLQHDTEMEIQKVNQDANKKFGEVQKRYQDLINSLNKDKKEDALQTDVQVQEEVQSDVKPDVQSDEQSEPAKEEVREKTHEEKVAEITDILLNHLRGSVSEKVNEIMCSIDKKANDTVVKSQDHEIEASVQKD